MKKCLVLLSGLIASSAALYAAEISSSLVRQQWPWSGLVHVDYILGDEDGGVHDVALSFASTSGEETIVPKPGSVSGDMYGVGPGEHKLVWDPSDLDQSAKWMKDIRATISLVDDPKMFMIIDVSGGADASAYPVSFTNAPPPGGWNQDEYKTSKIVLRRIPAGTFWMGLTSEEKAAIPSSDNHTKYYDSEDNRHLHLSDRRQVTLTRPYYIGIFPVTMGQHQKINGSSSVIESYIYSYTATSPMKNVFYKDVRGADAAAQWPGHGADSILGRLNAKTSARLGTLLPNYVFELPSHAQWENACRGGTATAFNSGKDFADGSTRDSDANLDELGWYAGNRTEAVAGLRTADSVHPVGLKLPNRFGCYDMHGNVMEWIRDLYGAADNYASIARTDPLVKGTSYLHVWACGGGAFSKTGRCISESLTDVDPVAEQTTYYSTNEYHCRGYRLACVYDGE